MPDYIYRALVLSVVKHDYLPNAVAAHPRFKLAAVADDSDRPQWTHDRNQMFADKHNIPYHRDVEEALLAPQQPAHESGGRERVGQVHAWGRSFGAVELLEHHLSFSQV